MNGTLTFRIEYINFTAEFEIGNRSWKLSMPVQYTHPIDYDSVKHTYTYTLIGVNPYDSNPNTKQWIIAMDSESRIDTDVDVLREFWKELKGIGFKEK